MNVRHSDRAKRNPVLRPHRLLLAASLAMALVPATGAAPAPVNDAGTITPAHWPKATWPLANDPAMERRIDALIAS
ncbi:hypothetical protein, partial [Bradyrhizobium sp. WBOS16]